MLQKNSHQQQLQQQHTHTTNPTPSILRRVNNPLRPPSTPPNNNNNRFSSPSSSITTPPPPSLNSPRVVNSSITPPPPPRSGVTPSPPNPNLLLPGETKINNNIVVKRKRNRRSKNFDTVTTPSPTRYIYPQPTFPTCYYPIPQIPVHPIPSLPLGIKGLYSNPYSATNYYPTHPSFPLQQQQLQQQQQPRYNTTIPATPPSKQDSHNKTSASKEEVLAEGNCIIDDENGFNTSDICMSNDSENSGHKRRSIVTKLRHLVNKTGECLTKTRLKEIENREKEEKEEILAYFKDDSPKPIPEKALLPENKDRKKILDLEFSQLVSISRSAFSHLAREYSKIGIDISMNRFVKPEKSSESTIPSLLSDTSHFFSMVESLVEASRKEIPQQDQMGSTVLNVLKTMESVLLDDTDTRILLSHPSTSVYPIENDSEVYYEDIVPQYLFYNNNNSNGIKETDSLNSSLIAVERSDFAQQADVNCSSITIQTDDKSVEEVSLQTSPIESSSVDIQTDEEHTTRSSIDIQTEHAVNQLLSTDVQTEPVNFAAPRKQHVTIETQTDSVEKICISTMTDELPVEKSVIEKPVIEKPVVTPEVEQESNSSSKKRKKDDTSSSSSSSSEDSESEEEQTKPKRKLRKRTIITTKTTTKKKDEPVYFVEKVVKHDNIDGKHWFYVKWEGFSSRFNSWVEEHDILDKSLIRKYIKK